MRTFSKWEKLLGASQLLFDSLSVLAMAVLSYRRANLLEVTNLQAAQVCVFKL